MVRPLILALVALLPWVIKKPVMARLFGYRFSTGARIGLALVDAREVDLGPNSSIGAFTIIRNLERLELGAEAKIGTFNWIFGAQNTGGSFAEEIGRYSALVLGVGAAITSRHLIDCIDRVDIGAFTTVAGYRSQFLTHAIDLRRNRQSCAPIQIGAHCFIGTGVIVLKGVTIPDRCAIGAGTVVGKSLPDEGFIYGGNPVQQRRAIDSHERYFSRTSARVK